MYAYLSYQKLHFNDNNVKFERNKLKFLVSPPLLFPVFFSTCLENKLSLQKDLRDCGANKMKWNRRENRAKEKGRFRRLPDAVSPRQTNFLGGDRDETGRLPVFGMERDIGCLYECRAVAKEWIEYPDLSLRRDEICRSTSVPLTPGYWEFIGTPRKLSDGTLY